MKRVCLHPNIAKLVLTLHILSLMMIIYIQVMSMREQRPSNIDKDSDITFLGGKQQTVLDDLRLLEELQNEEESENQKSNKTDMLDRFNGTYGIDEFFFRSSQSYEEVLNVKRFFGEEKVK